MSEKANDTQIRIVEQGNAEFQYEQFDYASMTFPQDCDNEDGYEPQDYNLSRSEMQALQRFTRQTLAQCEMPDDYKIMTELYTEYCPQGEKCKKKLCWGAHNASEIRRKLFNAAGELNYIVFPCPHQNAHSLPGQQSNCLNGDNCRNYHTENERMYHPSIYKTQFSASDLCIKRTAKVCSKGPLCPKVHKNDKDGRESNEQTSKSLTVDSQSQFEPIPSEQKGKRTRTTPIDAQMVDKARRQSASFTPFVVKKNQLNRQSTEESSDSFRDSTIESSVGNNKKNQSKSSSKSKKKAQVSAEVLLLDLHTFKTQICRNQIKHEKKKCPYYHDSKDRRRVGGNYGAEMCAYIIQKKKCPDEDRCSFAHNISEELYHHLKYKTKFCKDATKCEYAEFCSYAHSDDDILIDLLHKMTFDTDFYMFHFKTVWCPFSQQKEDHENRGKCVYAHNMQDFRRRPYQFCYQADKCQNWDSEKECYTHWEQGCVNGVRCQYSHGHKEHLYHPNFYKKLQCQLHVHDHCPYYHTESESRLPMNPFFRVMPKNRTLAFGGSSGRFGGDPRLGFAKKKSAAKNSDVSSNESNFSLEAFHSRVDPSDTAQYDPYEPGHRMSPIRTNYFSSRVRRQLPEQDTTSVRSQGESIPFGTSTFNSTAVNGASSAKALGEQDDSSEFGESYGSQFVRKNGDSDESEEESEVQTPQGTPSFEQNDYSLLEQGRNSMHNPQYPHFTDDSIFKEAAEGSTSQVVTEQDAAAKDAKDNQREEKQMFFSLPGAQVEDPGPGGQRSVMQTMKRCFTGPCRGMEEGKIRKSIHGSQQCKVTRPKMSEEDRASQMFDNIEQVQKDSLNSRMSGFTRVTLSHNHLTKKQD